MFCLNLQREESTVGLVIERERLDTETDGLRYVNNFFDSNLTLGLQRYKCIKKLVDGCRKTLSSDNFKDPTNQNVH